MKTNRTIRRVPAYAVTFLAVLALIYSFFKDSGKPAGPSIEFPSEADGSSFEVLSSDDNEMFIKLRLNDYSIIEAPASYRYRDVNDSIIMVKDFPQTVSPGDPSLPYLQRQIILPPATNPRSVKVDVVHLVEKEVKGQYSIAPVPPPLMDQELPTNEQSHWEATMWGEFKEIENGRNVLVYEKDEYYPADYYRVTAGGQLRKWKGASVHYSPFRYNPVQSKLVYAEELVLRISFDTDTTYYREKSAKMLMRDDSFDDLAEKLFVNYDQAKRWYQKALKDNVPAVSNEADDPNYAIVTTNAIYSNCDNLDDFCFHKQDLGFTVMVITEDSTHTVDGTPGAYSFVDAAGGYEGVVGDHPNGRPERIRKWLQDNYLPLGIEYVLLIGNPDPDNPEPDDLVGDVPMQLCWTSLVSEVPNDLFFADLTGDWNVDDDDYVGEHYSIADPAVGYSQSDLPAGINGDLFCVRWEGVIEVEGATGTAPLRLTTSHEGQTSLSVDQANDGFDAADLVIDETAEQRPRIEYDWLYLSDGTYPIRIEYRQSSADAYFTCYMSCYDETGTAKFSHDDGTGTYVNDLEADFFNDNDFSDPPDAEKTQSYLTAKHIWDGDRGAGGVDFLPEVYLGRIPFYNEDEDTDGTPDYDILDGILQRIMTYETSNPIESSWRRRVLSSHPPINDYAGNDGILDADYLGAETLMDNIAPPPLWEWFRIHHQDHPDVFPDADINTGCTVDDMVAAWNDPADPDDGRGIVMWRTHGSQVGASHIFHENRLDDLDNTKPSIVIQTTCSNGTPEESIWADGSHHYPLGYTLLKHGAIGTYSSSRTSGGGLFDPDNIDFDNKLNHYLMYFFGKGVMYNQEMGRIIAHVLYNDASMGSYWRQIFNYDLFGDPSLSIFGRHPHSNNDIIFVLDGSGSMLVEGKWQAAVNASLLYYDLMKTLRHPAFNDRYNTVVFRWSGSGPDADITDTVPPSTGLKDLSQPLTTASLAAYEPIASYCTPIGSGLQMAINALELESEESFYSNKKILLLSDGKHNRGEDPLTIVIPEGSGITIEAIGLGEDNIEPETIRDIAESSGGDYRITPTPREIIDYFVQILCNTSWKLQNLPVVASTVSIDQDYAVFIVAWDNPDDNIQFELNPPGGAGNVTPTNLTGYPPMEVTYHAGSVGKAYAYYVCKNIPDALLGNWSFDNINNGGVAVADADVLLKAIEDPRTIADFSIEQNDYYVGSPIVLTAEITEDGQPKLGLSNVYAELISSPEYAAGDLMARNEPSSDHSQQPVGDRTTRSHYLRGVMERLAITSLNSTSAHKIVLKDDGAGVDNTANDGIYTGTLTNVDSEGSYTFGFFASGTNKDGVIFKRSETLSEYVKFAAAPEMTEVKIIRTVKDKETNLATSTIRVIPRDAFGNYMGPFSGGKIKMYSNVGTFGDKYTDSLDGEYTFTLVHPSDEEPELAVSVENVVVAYQLPVKVQAFNWMKILLILLIIICIIYLYYENRKKS